MINKWRKFNLYESLMVGVLGLAGPSAKQPFKCSLLTASPTVSHTLNISTRATYKTYGEQQWVFENKRAKVYSE